LDLFGPRQQKNKVGFSTRLAKITGILSETHSNVLKNRKLWFSKPRAHLPMKAADWLIKSSFSQLVWIPTHVAAGRYHNLGLWSVGNNGRGEHGNNPRRDPGDQGFSEEDISVQMSINWIGKRDFRV
jgi:hypothetical protein